jgi:hypothetical protein
LKCSAIYRDWIADFFCVSNRGATAHIRLLFGGLDGARAGAANGGDRFLSDHSQFYEQPRPDRPGAAKTTTAMDKHATAARNDSAKIWTSSGPPILESPLGIGRQGDR